MRLTLLTVAAPWLLLLACSSADDSTLDSGSLADATQDDTSSSDVTAAEVAPPPPACAVAGDASFPDAYYPSVTGACTKAGDPCALPPNECVFDRYRIRYTHGYCSSSLTCVFSYVREMCGGADPVGCEAGICTCAQ